jgi:hypothetical protein
MAHCHRKTSAAAIAAGAAIAALGLSAATASASGIQSTSPMFRLDPATLEPGCFQLNTGSTHLGDFVDDHVTAGATGASAQVSVLAGANLSVDQVLVPGPNGYAIYNTFDTGTSNNDPDIDPTQTATGLTAPGGAADADSVIVCVSDHSDGDQNEPYVAGGLPGEVAAVNRPIIQPTIAALGASALGDLHTYKVGFGYQVLRHYDSFWKSAFVGDGIPGDPDATPWVSDQPFDHVSIETRAEQPGVSGYNDIDEFGEQFSNGQEKSDYGQPILFDVSGSGDPDAYLHTSRQDQGDETGGTGLTTFTTEGDLPLSWAVKPSLAPQGYGRKVTLTDDMFRAWNAAWQAYYAGKGPKPALPLAPGTNSPAPNPSITVLVNSPESRPSTAPQQPVPAAAVSGGKTGTAAVKTAVIQSARLVRAGGHRMVEVRVSSPRSTARIDIRLMGARGSTLARATKTVPTNRRVRVSGLHVSKRVTSVRASIAR